MIACIILKAITVEENQFKSLDNECTCPSVTYKCTIKSSTFVGITVWNGTAFDCPEGGNSVILVHNIFNESSIPERECNDGSYSWMD